MKLFAFLFAIVLVTGCTLFTKEAPVSSISARVNDYVLYKSQIEDAVPKSLTQQDSIRWVNDFIESWVQEKAFLSEAVQELPNDRKEFAEKLKEYEQALLQHSYEEYLAEKADTAVTETQILDFYLQNEERFQIVEPMLQCRYVVLDKKAPSYENALKLLSTVKASDVKKMDDYFFRYSLQYSLNDSTWQKMEVVSSKLNNAIGIEKMHVGTVLVGADSLNVYGLYIKKLIQSGGQAPYSYSREQAKQLLQLNLRSSYVERAKEKIYQKALSKNNIEIKTK